MTTEYTIQISSGDDDAQRLVALLQQRVNKFAVFPNIFSSGPRGRRLQEIRFATVDGYDLPREQLKDWMRDLFIVRFSIASKQAAQSH